MPRLTGIKSATMCYHFFLKFTFDLTTMIHLSLCAISESQQCINTGRKPLSSLEPNHSQVLMDPCRNLYPDVASRSGVEWNPFLPCHPEVCLIWDCPVATWFHMFHPMFPKEQYSKTLCDIPKERP